MSRAASMVRPAPRDPLLTYPRPTTIHVMDAHTDAQAARVRYRIRVAIQGERQLKKSPSTKYAKRKPIMNFNE